MQLNLSTNLNLHFSEAEAKIKAAAKSALRDVVVEVTEQAKIDSPVSEKYPSIAKNHRRATGNNRDSIQFQVGPEGELELNEMQGAVYSTSGYGGYLETGTSKMPARPYIYPAASERFTEGEMKARIQEKLGE